MAVRQFASTDLIETDPGNISGTPGSLTMASLMKHTDASAGGNWMIPSVNNAGDDQTFTFYFASNAIHLWVNNTGGILNTTVTGGSGAGWAIYVVTKTSGTSVARGHRFSLGGSWVHTNSATTSAHTSNVVSQMIFGSSSHGAGNANRMAVAAMWDNVALSDPQVEELAAGLQTTDWLANSGGAPGALWEFNQSVVTNPVEDLTGGGANQKTRTGTTVVNGDDPPGWTFGLVPPPPPVTDAPEKIRVVRSPLRLA